MGIFNWLFGSGNNSNHNQTANNNTGSVTQYQDNSVHYGDNGPTCPFDWQIGYSTCGCCPKANGCEKWHNLKDRALKNFGNGY